MIQTFHSFVIQSAVILGAAHDVINGLNDNTTAAIEIDNDFEWIVNGN